jgi:hypothetical protein
VATQRAPARRDTGPCVADGASTSKSPQEGSARMIAALPSAARPIAYRYPKTVNVVLRLISAVKSR